MNNYIRPLLIAALLTALAVTAYAAPTQQKLLQAYAKHPQVQRVLSARADVLAAYQDALDAVRVTSQLKLSYIDRQIDALLMAVHKQAQAKRAAAPRKVPKVGKKMPTKGEKKFAK